MWYGFNTLRKLNTKDLCIECRLISYVFLENIIGGRQMTLIQFVKSCRSVPLIETRRLIGNFKDLKAL